MSLLWRRVAVNPVRHRQHRPPTARTLYNQSQDTLKQYKYPAKPRKAAAVRDEEMKVKYPPYQLPDTSKLQLTRNTAHVDEYLERLQRSPNKVTAFDMEWNRSFKPGFQRRTGLIQIAHEHVGFLLYSVPRGYYHELPSSLKAYLKDSSMAKVGLNIKNDMIKITRDWPNDTFTFNRVIDLSDMAKVVDRPKWLSTPHVISLQELTGVYLERYLSKAARGSTNWESLALDAEALQYAAGDTLASLQLYDRLLQLAASKNVDLQDRHIWSSEDKLSVMSSKLSKDFMTPRQTEAWMLTFAHQGFNIDGAARKMGIQSSSVGRYLIEGLGRQKDSYLALEAEQISQLLQYARCQPHIVRKHAELIQLLERHLGRPFSPKGN